MRSALTDRQQAVRDQAERYAGTSIAPFADAWDREQMADPQILRTAAGSGLLGALVPKRWGGSEMDWISVGLMFESIGHASASVASMFTVHAMVSHAIKRWGNAEQKERWLSSLADGRAIAAFALSETNVGSDAKSVEMTAVEEGDAFVLTGEKTWISSAQIADLFLVIARLEDAPSAFLVPANTDGVRVRPIRDLLGFRAAMLGTCTFDRARVPKNALLGAAGFGFSHVTGTALDLGRYAVAWSSVGLLRACLEASARYAGTRIQFGRPIREHQLVQAMLAGMAVRHEAARLLCLEAGDHHDAQDPRAITATLIAKYFASTSANQAAQDAVQIHGANGVSPAYPVERYLRDAKILEIIEGSTQMLETVIAQQGLTQQGVLR